MTNSRTHREILNFHIKQRPVQEDAFKKAWPTAQLQKANPRTRGKILNFQIKQKPIQEDSLKKHWAEGTAPKDKSKNSR